MRLHAFVVLAASVLVGAFLTACGSDTACPIGYFPSAFGGCVPIEATDLGTDTAGSDLGDGGIIEDAPTSDGGDDAGDTALPDAPGPDAPEPDVPEPDVPEPDVCTPDCDGFECGPDGCGGTCGSCRDVEACVDGTCREREFPAPADCADGFECAAPCGEDEDCVTECGVFAASGALQRQIFDALDCGYARCGGDATAAGWIECAIASCPAVRECLEIEPPGDGACTNPTDLGIIEDTGAEGMSAVIGNCTLPCFGNPDVSGCVGECVSGETGLSGSCSACFGDVGACTLTACIFECIDPSNPACQECVAASCGAAFEECAGISIPG